MFTILVLMAIITTLMTTPMVLAVYKPALASSSASDHLAEKKESYSGQSSIQHVDQELRILSCVHGPGDVPSMVNLIELTRGAEKFSLKLYSVHLVELNDSPSSIMLIHRARRNGIPFVNRLMRGQVEVAFKAYGEVSRIPMRSTTAISGLHSMHEDICRIAQRKRANVIILPFHKKWKLGDNGIEIENLGDGWRAINQEVLEGPPCSVAVFVDRGFGADKNKICPTRICILLIRGPDDCEALNLGIRMSESTAAMVTITRFIPATKSSWTSDQDSYEAALAELLQQIKWCETMKCTERIASSVVNQAVEIGQSGEYDLILVGRRSFPATLEAGLTNQETEYKELGAIGDALASSNNGVISSLLVIQQHDYSLVNEAPIPNLPV